MEKKGVVCINRNYFDLLKIYEGGINSPRLLTLPHAGSDDKQSIAFAATLQRKSPQIPQLLKIRLHDKHTSGKKVGPLIFTRIEIPAVGTVKSWLAVEKPLTSDTESLPSDILHLYVRIDLRICRFEMPHTFPPKPPQTSAKRIPQHEGRRKRKRGRSYVSMSNATRRIVPAGVPVDRKRDI